jgi:type II/III secretion system protein
MSSRVLRIGAACVGLLAAGWLMTSAGPAHAADTSRPVTLELSQVPLSQVIQLLAANADVEIIFNDPEGKLADRPIRYIKIQNRTIEEAIAKVCRAADVYYEKDRDGVYFITAQRPQKPAVAPPGPDVRPMGPIVPEERVTDKVSLAYMDPNECVRFLTTSHARKPLSDAGKVKSLDELDILPGLVDPATGNWYLPQSSAPVLPPIFSPGASKGAGAGITGGQGFAGGGVPGGIPGGIGPGGPGGIGTGLPGAGVGAGQGGVANLLPQGIQGVLGYPLDNSLIVQGTPEAIEELKRIIRLLDIPPRQIAIKIESIAVTSTFEKTFGLDFSISYNDIDIRTGIGFSSGGAIQVAILGDNWRASFSAAVATGKATVIESFQITTMNNVQALIQSTQTTFIFLPQTIAVQGAGVQTNFVPFPLQASTFFVAIPRLNGDGTITMVIPIQFTRFLGESVGPDGTRIPNVTQTSLVALRRVASGQTIVVGGIINRNDTNNSSGIPILRDLPIVGPLFRSQRNFKNQTETLFFFTPTLLPEPVATGAAE